MIINTGGTFNKKYNPISGMLEVTNNSRVIDRILRNYDSFILVSNIIGKDSLEFTDKDRQEILNEIKGTLNKNIIVIHGTDTMEKSAQFISDNVDDKNIVFVGSMTPFSIEPIDATLNLGIAMGFLKGKVVSNDKDFNVYICMNGIIDKFNLITKNRKKGAFEYKEQ